MGKLGFNSIKRELSLKLSKPRHYWIVFFIFSILLILYRVMPVIVDQYVQFRPLLCWTAKRKEFSQSDLCQMYQTSIFGIEYFRAWAYLGISSSVLALPLFLFFSAPMTFFILTATAMFLVVYGFRKSFDLGWIPSIGSLTVFPIFYNLIFDAGPVRISMLTIIWTPYFVKIFIKNSDLGIRFISIISISILWIISTDDKAFFIFLIPSIITYVSVTYKFRIITIFQLFSVPIFSVISYLFLVRAESISYFSYLTQHRVSPGIKHGMISGFLYLSSPPFNLNRIVENGYFSNSKTLQIISSRDVVFYFIALVSSVITLIYFLRALRFIRHSAENIGILLGSLLMFFCIVLAGGWQTHHFVFVNIFLYALFVKNWKNFPIKSRALISRSYCVTLSAVLIAACCLPRTSISDGDFNRAFNLTWNYSTLDKVINIPDQDSFIMISASDKRIQNSHRIVSIATAEKVVKFLSRNPNVSGMYLLCQNCDGYISDSRFTSEKIQFRKQGNWSRYLVRLSHLKSE